MRNEDKKMKCRIQFVRRSPFTGQENSMILEVDPVDLEAWENGELIQNAMPYLSADEREFIKTGITPDEWDSMFGGEE
jgi:hypothetical protein